MLRIPSGLLLVATLSVCTLLISNNHGNSNKVSAFVLPGGGRPTATGTTTATRSLKHQHVIIMTNEASSLLFQSTTKLTSTTTRQSESNTNSDKNAQDKYSLSKTRTSTPLPTNRRPSNQESLEESYPQFPRTWIPLASTLELDPNRPTPVEFLGQKYVIYRSSSSQDDKKDKNNNNQEEEKWVVMDNACPHRLAPLSEGRVDPETRQLQCSYHGWTFDADGSCQNIPQAVPSTLETAMQNPRSCVPTYSTYKCPKTGVLWIWPWQQDSLAFISEVDEWRHPEGIMKNMFENSNSNNSGSSVMTYTRDQPYGWDTLVENLIDPAHIPFAHHGMQGSRTDAIPINMTSATDRKEAGFSFQWDDRTMGMLRSGTGEFRAPFLVNYEANFDLSSKKGASDDDSNEGGQRPWQLAVLCVPTRPGWSRVMVFTGQTPDKVEKADAPKAAAALTDEASPTTAAKKTKKKKKKTSLFSLIFRNLPTWVSHLLSNKFFDSDMAFLHYQEQVRRPPTAAAFSDSSGSDGSSKLQRGDARYYMPSEADRSIAALHAWIGKYAPSYVRQQATHLPAAIYDRSILFDHWGQHTSSCKICQDALAGIQKWKRNSKIVLAASILLGFRHWAPRILAALSIGVYSVLVKTEGAFYKGEFKHYENH